MITISNSEGLWAKFKNFLTSSDDSPVDEPDVVKTPTQDEEKDKQEKQPEVTIFDKPVDDVTPEPEQKPEPELELEPVFEVLADPDPGLECLSAFANYDQTQVKRVLFKIDKSKFEYPYAKSTTLSVKTNLPIVKSIQSYQEKKEFSDTVQVQGACPQKDVYGSYSIDYTEASVKLLIDFSVALYQQIDPTLLPCTNDINNVDIYALEDSSFLNEPFYFCYTGDCVGLSPYDFKVVLSTTQTTVSPVCELDDYYLYVVDVSVTVSFLDKITIYTTDTKSLAAINAKVGEPPTNNTFTRTQLASITSIDFSDNPDLDFNLFVYLLNLSELDISKTTSDPDKLDKLAVLNQLLILIAKDNNLQDYNPFAKIPSLKKLYLDNTVVTTSSISRFRILSTRDITPLTTLNNLEVLSLGNNGISFFPTLISGLRRLRELNLANNNLADIAPIAAIPSLVQLNLSSNRITVLPSSAVMASLSNLTSLNLNNNSIVDASSLSGLSSLEDLSMENNPVDPETIPPNIPLTHLDLHATNLTQEGFDRLTLPETLRTLDISNNKLYDLSRLLDLHLEGVMAINQLIENYTILEPDVDDPTMFILNISFIKDIYPEELNILDISNGGEFCNAASCYEPIIIWKDISSETEVSFKFINIYESFSGEITLTLSPLSDVPQ